MKRINIEQRQCLAQDKKTLKDKNHKEECKLVQLDLQGLDMEKQINAFKKQLFRQEMMEVWARQSKHKKNL